MNVPVTSLLLTAAEIAHRAELAMKARNYLSAHKEYRKAAEIAEKAKDGNAPRYWFGAGLAVDLHAETLREPPSRVTFLRDAVVAYRRSLELEPAAPWSENNLALIELDLGLVNEAASRLASLVERSRGKENYALFATNLGDVQARQEHWSDALQSYRSAILAEPSLTRAVDSFVRVARSHDASQVTSLLEALLRSDITDVAARLATDAFRDPALANLRPAIGPDLVVAAAQYVRQGHPERAIELLSVNEDEAILAARELLRTNAPNESTPATPSLRYLAATLGDASASAGKSEEAERLYVYGDANARLVDLYLGRGDRAKLTTLAKKFEDAPVATSPSAAAAAYEFHRAAMAAYGALGDDPAAPEGTASFHAQKAKTFGGIGKIDVREIDIYEQQLKPPARSDPLRSRN